MDTSPYEVTINLKQEGLTHAKGKSDGCDGKHEVTIDLFTEGLHADGDCLDNDVLAVLQKLHEAAHPHGSVYIQNCLEAACTDVVYSLGYNR